jgi:hypothetical protein
VIETSTELPGKGGFLRHLGPVEEQVVEIEHALRLLGLDISGKQPLQFLRPAAAPRERVCQHLIERCLRIHRARIDRETRGLGRKPAFRLRQAELVADEVHQVG